MQEEDPWFPTGNGCDLAGTCPPQGTRGWARRVEQGSRRSGTEPCRHRGARRGRISAGWLGSRAAPGANPCSTPCLSFPACTRAGTMPCHPRKAVGKRCWQKCHRGDGIAHLTLPAHRQGKLHRVSSSGTKLLQPQSEAVPTLQWCSSPAPFSAGSSPRSHMTGI